MVRGPIHQEDVTMINIYTLNNRVPKIMWQKLTELKGERDNSRIIIIGDFSDLLSITNRTTKQLKNKPLKD